MFAKRTDLAVESRTLYHAAQGREPQGVDVEEYAQDGVEVTRIVVRNSRGAATIGKPEGVYITAALGAGWLQSPQWLAPAARVLAGLLRPLLPDSGCVLVCGLGNRGETLGLRPVCALATGVLGRTGIETAEIIRGVCSRVRPRAVIAIDALAAMGAGRLCRTFQISDTGIVPGSGAHNARSALSQKELGVPVIAMGVPTVIEAATLVADALEQRGLEPDGHASAQEGMLVTPKDIDALIQKSAKVIGYAINLALQGDMSADEIEQLLA